MKLAVFFTRGISFKKWKESGILDREIQPYIKLADNFEEIFFLSYGNSEDLNIINLPKNIKILINNTFLPDFLYTFLIPFLHRKILKKVDILKTNQMDGSWSAVISKKLFGNKLVVRSGYEWLQYLENTNSFWWKKKFAYFVEKYSYKNADKIIITSEGGKKFIENRFNINEEKINLIPNYIDIDKFKPINIEKDSSRLIFVGRLEPVKNIPNLIKALVGTSTQLTIVGEGRQKDIISKLAIESKLDVDFKGVISQNDLPSELNSNSIFILPSLSEGNPKSLLEAMSCGLACIGSDIDGITGIIRDKQNGIICSTNVESINLAIKTLLEDSELRSKISKNARKSIEEGFSLHSVIEKELSIYKSI